MVLNVTKILQKIKNESFLIKEKNVIERKTHLIINGNDLFKQKAYLNKNFKSIYKNR